MIDRMDPAACRSHLQALLSDESTLLTRLAQQLVLEHELLVANDVEELEAAGDARQATVASLLRIEDDRSGLCRQVGRSPDRDGLSGLLQWCDPTGTLAVAYSDVSGRAAQCRAQNDRNGALVSARLARVQTCWACSTWVAWDHRPTARPRVVLRHPRHTRTPARHQRLRFRR